MPSDEQRPWPPRTVREWIALQRYDAKEPWWWTGEAAIGHEEAVDDLERFLDYDWSTQLNAPGEGDHFPERTTPPPIDADTDRVREAE